SLVRIAPPTPSIDSCTIRTGASTRCAISMAHPMPPVSPCALWPCSGTSTPTGLVRAATTRRGARRSTTSMASSITPTGSTTCSSPPPWEGENYEPRNPMESAIFNLMRYKVCLAREFSGPVRDIRKGHFLVAYLRLADKYLGLLARRLRGVNQPVIRTRRGFQPLVTHRWPAFERKVSAPNLSPPT